jgi:hypothetical protein
MTPACNLRVTGNGVVPKYGVTPSNVESQPGVCAMFVSSIPLVCLGASA